MDEPFLAKIKVQESTEELLIQHLSDDLYRMEETSIFNLDLGLGVLAKLRLCENQEYEVVRIVEKSSYITYDWMLSPSFIQTDEFRLLKQKIEEYGGRWEQVMSGIFMAHIPEKQNKGFLKDLSRNNILIKKRSFWAKLKKYCWGAKEAQQSNNH